METNKIAELIEWIDTEANLVKVQDGFLYHGQYFTNEQIIEIFKNKVK
jgi:hypothetical protein